MKIELKNITKTGNITKDTGVILEIDSFDMLALEAFRKELFYRTGYDISESKEIMK